MRQTHRLAIGLVAAGLLVSGCFGPFNLTRRLYQWNAQSADKWEREFFFLLLAFAPVYSLTIAGDAIVFNSMEFWTGNNPVDPPHARIDSPSQTKRIVRGEAEAVLTYTPTPAGAELLIEYLNQGNLVANFSFFSREGRTVALDSDGRILLTAESLPDGGIIIRDRNGHEMETYSASQVTRVMASARRITGSQ